MNDQAISSLGESGDQSEEFWVFRLFPSYSVAEFQTR